MANKKFLEKMKNTSTSQDSSDKISLPDILVDEENEDDDLLESLSNPKLNQKKEEPKVLIKKIEKTIDEDFGGIGESKPISPDLSNLPPVHSLNLEKDTSVEEEEEVVEEKPKPARRPGRPKVVREPEVKDEPEKKSPIKKENIETDSDISNRILMYICAKTIEFLIENYESKIYTPDYTAQLFKDYLDKMNDCNEHSGDIRKIKRSALFLELISECIAAQIKDPYLGDLTMDILSYIKDGEGDSL